jgi:hypothetical protein
MNIIIESQASVNVTSLLSVTMYDSELFVIDNEAIQVIVHPGFNLQNVSLFIPSYAFVGVSEAFINLLDDKTEMDGLPYCPEISTKFMVTDKLMDTEVQSRTAFIGVQAEGNNFTNFTINSELNSYNGLHFPYGVFSFNISVEPGSAVNVTLNLFDREGEPVQLDPSLDYWKYSPDGKGSPSGEPGWFNLSSILANNTMTFTLIDGGEGDFDGLENGVIQDPGGPAVRMDLMNNYSPVGGELIKQEILLLIRNVKNFILSLLIKFSSIVR